MGTAPVRTRRWTRVEYERLIDRGIFRDDERLELLDGVIVCREPQGDPHAAAVDLIAAALRRAFGEGWLVRAHGGVALDRRSRPEPDAYVVPGSPRDYRNAAPTRPALVVEVSESRLGFDRTRKAALYARAGVEDYWIVNLVDRVLEVRRDPARLDIPGRRWGYRSVASLGPAEGVTPLAAPQDVILVADLLP